jgi:ParB family chromosome partitioning protein
VNKTEKEMKKKALGKGIEALIPKKEGAEEDQQTKLDINAIVAGRFQPRMNFDSTRHEELVSSIREKGIMQPLVVRPVKSPEGIKYEVIAGERRLRALKELDFKEAPVIIRNVKDEEALELSLIENIQREELNAIEEAHAYERLINEFSLSQDNVAKAVGKSRSAVNNSLRLLKLPLVIQDYVSRGTISMGHARALLSLEDKSKQIAMAEKIAKKGLSVREVESLVRQTEKPAKTTRVRQGEDPHLKAAEEGLQNSLGTKVSIVKGRKKGKIIIDYYSANDLERLIKILTK